MRMSGLLLASLAMVAIVSSAQARPSAPVHRGGRRSRARHADHADPSRRVPERVAPAFRADVNALAQRAPTISRNELLVGMLRIIALLGPRNGHTGLFPGDPAHARELTSTPCVCTTSSTACTSSTRPTGRSSGTVSLRSRACPTERVLELVEPLVPRDNPSNLRGLAPHYLLTAEVLDGLGVVDGIGPADVHVRAARRPARRHRADARCRVALHRRLSPTRYSVTIRRSSRRPRGPLYLSGSAKPLWARTLAGGAPSTWATTPCARPRRCCCGRSSGSCGRKSVRRVIVDLRLNGGGDNTTYGSLTPLFGSKAVNKRGKLQVLIGRATFSAAANFAAEIDRATRAVFVGEPTGGGVETYGDTFPVLLPTVGWTVHIAARYHERKRSESDRRLAIDARRSRRSHVEAVLRASRSCARRALKGL